MDMLEPHYTHAVVIARPSRNVARSLRLRLWSAAHLSESGWKKVRVGQITCWVSPCAKSDSRVHVPELLWRAMNPSCARRGVPSWIETTCFSPVVVATRACTLTQWLATNEVSSREAGREMFWKMDRIDDYRSVVGLPNRRGHAPTNQGASDV